MRARTLRRGVRAAAVVLVLGLPATALAGQPASGELIARTYCAGCHATGRTGQSPLLDAPPFRELSRRGPLPDLLSQGMIAGPSLQEEGERPKHPRMPQAMLDEAQLGDLLSYLRSIQLARPAPAT